MPLRVTTRGKYAYAKQAARYRGMYRGIGRGVRRLKRRCNQGRTDRATDLHKYVRSSDVQYIVTQQGNLTAGTYGIYSQTSAGATLGASNDVLGLAATAAAMNYASISLVGILQGMPSYSEFTALYDLYKITGFSIKILPMYNAAPVGGAAVPYIHSVIDYDDSVLFTAGAAGIQSMKQYASYKVQPLSIDGASKNAVFYRYVRAPRTKSYVVNASGTSEAALTSAPKWTDCAVTDIPHFGMKLILEWLTQGAGTYNFKLEFKYYLKFREVR